MNNACIFEMKGVTIKACKNLQRYDYPIRIMLKINSPRIH